MFKIMNKLMVGDLILWKYDDVTNPPPLEHRDVYLVINSYASGYNDFFTLLNCRTKKLLPYFIVDANRLFVKCDEI
jgi:hypothetical protein